MTPSCRGAGRRRSNRHPAAAGGAGGPLLREANRLHARRYPPRSVGFAMSAYDPTLDTPCEPCVGIFWREGGVLITDRSTLAEAVAWPATMSGGSFGAGLVRRGLAELGLPATIASTEYDEWPRGRIVHEEPAGRFVVYADRRLQAPEIITVVKNAFGLDGAEAVVKSDLHYR